MRVLVTGGTGFVGSFAALALLRAGHEVRLLVRRPEQVAVTFAPHGVAQQDIVQGDVLDEDAVRAAVQGCDAVLPLSPRIARASTIPVHAVQKVLPERVRYPADPEGVETVVRDCRLDDASARLELGVQPRPWQETVDDMVTWLVDAGRLPARYRPRVA